MKRSKFFAVPPGKSIKEQCLIFGTIYFLALMYSLIFVVNIYEFRRNEKVMSIAPRYQEMVSGCFTGFLFLMVLCLAAVIFNYMEFTIGSKSIYVMRRVPDRTLFIRQCVSVPAVFFLLSAVTAVILQAVYYLSFCHIFSYPAEDLVNWQELWRCFI